MKNIFGVLLISGLLFAFSCSTEKKDGVSKNTNFKLGDFFSQQIDSLQKNSLHLHLKTTLNKDVSDTILQEVNWQKQLQLFSDLAIENPKYKDSFVCDTILAENGAVLLKYKAIEDNSKIKLVEIFIVNQHVKTVFAKLNSSNYLYDASTVLYYETDNYFTIEAKDNFPWLGFLNSDLSIKGFIK